MSGPELSAIANDNPSIFADFMMGYWNEMASEVYSSFDAALVDFRETEGAWRFARLRDALMRLNEEGRFPTLDSIADAYNDPFWKPYRRILTVDDLAKCEALA